jgi:hypothetical protein
MENMGERLGFLVWFVWDIRLRLVGLSGFNKTDTPRMGFGNRPPFRTRVQALGNYCFRGHISHAEVQCYELALEGGRIHGFSVGVDEIFQHVCHPDVCVKRYVILTAASLRVCRAFFWKSPSPLRFQTKSFPSFFY